MKVELEEFRTEATHLKNQQATIRRLEERNRQLEQQVSNAYYNYSSSTNSLGGLVLYCKSSVETVSLASELHSFPYVVVFCIFIFHDSLR